MSCHSSSDSPAHDDNWRGGYDRAGSSIAGRLLESIVEVIIIGVGLGIVLERLRPSKPPWTAKQKPQVLKHSQAGGNI